MIGNEIGEIRDTICVKTVDWEAQNQRFNGGWEKLLEDRVFSGDEVGRKNRLS